MMFKNLSTLALITSLTACQTVSENQKTVEVYRLDESRQCAPNSGISPETMKSDLGNIQVYAMRKDDLRGVMFPSVCGGSTGSVNVYTIDESKLQIAKTRGFEVFGGE